MKQHLLLIACTAGALTFAACSSDGFADEVAATEVAATTKALEPDESLFPETDSSTMLYNADRSTGLSRCIAKVPDDFALAWDGTKANEAEYKEIGDAVAELIEGKETELQKFLAIYQWVTRNVKYDTKGENRFQSAYYTFQHKLGNCQGYSNLLNTMCHAAGIAAFNANGFVTAQMLGHAWNYVKADGKWYVVDSTNSRYWAMTPASAYNQELFPNQIDVTLFEDDNFVYNWFGGALAITEVKAWNKPQLTVPFSIEGLRLFSFNPQKALPASIREIYLGSNITQLGEESNIGLTKNGKNIEAIYIDAANRILRGEHGIAYKRKGQQVELLFLPPMMSYVELSPSLKTLLKNTIQDNTAVETLVIPTGVAKIEPWAVENAPNLRTIYVPEDCKYLDYDANYNFVEYDEPTPNTFTGVHPNCEIIKGMPTTGIREVRM